jgi:hypothetical protein
LRRAATSGGPDPSRTVAPVRVAPRPLSLLLPRCAAARPSSLLCWQLGTSVVRPACSPPTQPGARSRDAVRQHRRGRQRLLI